ncbi:MAG: ABC transporter ATP-binding protein [Bacilli bacterium]|nr:ABC transporter ATP-binding protein [Bacilli bacterium]
MNSFLEIKGLKSNNLDISIEKNTISTFSGANNCGKTTLIRILSKLLDCESEITLENKKISDYKLEEYNEIVKSVIPKEITFDEINIEEELYNKCYLEYKEKEQIINYIIKGLKIKKILTKDIKTLNSREITLTQIAIALINKPKLLLIDSLDIYFNLEDQKTIINFLKDYISTYGLTVVITTTDLEISLETNYLYIIDKGDLVLSGAPQEVLQKDNVINKIGLNIPFMIDLSVKLRDYELIKDIETDYDRMIEALWK